MAVNPISSSRIGAPLAEAQKANLQQTVAHRSELRGEEGRQQQRAHKAEAADSARAVAHQRVEQNHAAAAARRADADQTARNQRAEAKAKAAQPSIGGNIDTTA